MGAQYEHALIPLPENQFAQAAVEQLFSPELEMTPPLVYLAGPSGVGKSHLIVQGIEKLLNRYEGVRYRILSVYEFATLNMEAASHGADDAHEILESLEEMDLLVCEDLQHLDRQIWLQKKLILLLDQLLQAGARVLLSSQFPVGEFEQALPKLVSRFHAGVTASISLPCERSRVNLLHHYAEHHEIPLSNHVAQTLARELPVSPRELLGVIVQLEAIQRLQGIEITSDVVQNLLELQQPRNKPTLSEVARSVAKEFGVSVQAIRSAAREQSLLVPRQVAMLLSRELIQANYAEIGAYFGGRSHSTVMHACQALMKKSGASAELDYRLSQLRRALQGMPVKPR